MEPQIYIDVQDIPQLKSYSTEPTLTLGGNVSLNDCIKLFKSLSKKNSSYAYTSVLASHIDLIANVPVRNVSHQVRTNCYALTAWPDTTAVPLK
jgi:xanthine dehydrogenase/oxidase